MKLTILTDNNTFIDRYYFGEPALSFLLEDDSEKILFDTGYTDLFIKNAALMGENLTDVGKVVISHGHIDHTGGLEAFAKNCGKRLPLIAHPHVFDRKFFGDESIGSIMTYEEASEAFELRLSKEPVKISKSILFLGEVPQTVGFEPRMKIGCVECGGEMQDDYNIDDSALVYTGKEGIYVITGCSHSGICNIIEYAKKVTGQSRVQAVIGGFHLLKNDERLEKTIEYFQINEIPLVYPCHCVSLHARASMIQKLNVIETGTGFMVNFK